MSFIEVFSFIWSGLYQWFYCALFYVIGESNLQVTEATANILSSHGFVLEKRGSVPVKGKGELTTFFVVSEPRKS